MLLNLIRNEQPDTDKLYLSVEDAFESKYQLLINGREIAGIKRKTKKSQYFAGNHITVLIESA